MSWIFLPREAFRLGTRKVIGGQLLDGVPLITEPKRVIFYAQDQSAKEITLVGTATASRFSSNEIDYRYEGPEILSSEIGNLAVVTDDRGRYADGRAYYSVQRTELPGGDCHWGCRDEDELKAVV